MTVQVGDWVQIKIGWFHPVRRVRYVGEYGVIVAGLIGFVPYRHILEVRHKEEP